LGDRFYAEDEDEDWAEEDESDDPLAYVNNFRSHFRSRAHSVPSYLHRLAQKKKTRAIPTVDHSTVEYEAFEKNFYIEVPEIKKMTKEEVKTYRKEYLEDVKVRGKGCPKPIKEFSQCGLSSKMYAVLKHHGYKKPTPIQAQAIPAIMSGRDIIGIYLYFFFFLFSSTYTDPNPPYLQVAPKLGPVRHSHSCCLCYVMLWHNLVS